MIDTHVHLNFPDLLEQLPAVLERAREAGVTHFVVPGTTAADSTSGVDISAMRDSVYAAVGVHPSDWAEYGDSERQQLLSLLKADNKVVSMGEVGLDYYHFAEDISDEERARQEVGQQNVFREMITLAKEYQLPLIIHSRGAYEDTRRILAEDAPGHPTVIHCFTGTQEEADGWLGAGCLLSFTGIITYKKNEALREVVKNVPLEWMMIETDAPFLAPEGFRGQLCEPKFVRNVAECIAQVKGISLEEVDRVTTATAKAFFNLK